MSDVQGLDARLSEIQRLLFGEPGWDGDSKRVAENLGKSGLLTLVGRIRAAVATLQEQVEKLEKKSR